MQPTPDIANKLEAKPASPASSDWLAAAAPWHAHLLWLVPAVATVTYLNNRDWGMFEAIPWIIALAVAMTGWYAWSIAWSVLSAGRIGGRLAYLAIGMGGMLGTLMATTGWPNEPDQFALVVGHLGVGWAVPMILVRRRGWQLARLPRPEPTGLAATTPFWQFSIGDLLVLTAGLAIYLGLLLANRSHPWQEVLLEVLLLVSGTGIVLVGLSWRRFWLAAVASTLGTATLFLITVAAVNPDALAQPAELQLAVVVFGPAVVLLLAAIGIVRSCGYRLQRGNYTVPSVNAASTNRQPAT
jgi:hypothetical protein